LIFILKYQLIFNEILIHLKTYPYFNVHFLVVLKKLISSTKLLKNN
jgi:hypothetical protein